MWCVIPAAGSGRRLGGETPKQYQLIRNRSLLAWTMDRIASHPAVAGLMVVLAPDDPHWPGLATLHDKPVRTAVGGSERSDSVLAGLRALASIPDAGPWVMVHDAARPCVRHLDLDQLVLRGCGDPVGAILAGRVRDTLKHGGADGRIDATMPRENVWRAFTPQLLRRELLQSALETNSERGSSVTDDANALEVLELFPLLIESSEDNLKVTSGTDMERVEDILESQGAFRRDPESFCD
jgi:2-C-methyl-D-erythritol 4-phosphate cytidylyltransferase